MSASVLQAVLRADLKPAAVKLMALVVAFHFNDEKGRAWAGLGTMARECGMSERHAKRTLATLKKMGVLVVLRATAGGERYTTTTHYGFNLQALAGLSSPVRQRTGGAGALGAVMGAERDIARDGECTPSAPAAPDPVRRRPAPSAPAAPKRDERKPEASLSSKAPAAPESADGRPSAAGDNIASAKVVQLSTVRKQPALDGDLVRLRHLAPVVTESVPEWLTHDDLLSAAGIKFGLGPLAEFRAQGGDRLGYVRQVIDARAAVIKQLKAHRAALKRGASQADVAVLARAVAQR